MDEVKKILELCKQSNWIPKHNCKLNLKILEETHSVNTMHNIVISRKSICVICAKVFEQYDPKGL